MRDNVYKFMVNCKKYVKCIFSNTFFLWLISSIVLTLIVENISLLSDRTLYGSSQFDFVKFTYNLLLIMLSSSFIFLFKKRIFWFSLVSLTWIGLSLGNKMLLSFRGSPLTISDIQMANMGLTLINQYFTKVQIYLAIILILIIVALFILLFIKSPKKQKVNYFLIIPSIIAFAFCFKGYSNKLISSQVLSTNFWDITTAYNSYGFPYSFTSTVFNYGIEKPNGYSEDYITNLSMELNTDTLTSATSDIYSSISVDNQNTNKKPNIIMVQLESFFDPTLMNDLTFSEDPIPNFRRLSEEYSSGYLTVPVIGGGTSNTEFEVITGLSTKLFGPGQFPYNSLLQTSTSESMAYYLKDQGYSTTAMHNHEAIFYGRNVAYANLGFDRFVPRETMNVEYTPTYYAKDTVFINDIPELISSTEEKDFIYAVSVQGHGSYPDYEILPEVNITVDGEDLSEGDKNSWQYYVQQIHEMDQVVMNLINKVNETEEPTVIAFYGDHLPSLGISNTRLNKGTIYDTPLLIWDNIGLEKEDLSLPSYQLSAYLLDKLNIPGGIISSLHQLKSNDEDYFDELHALQYDILYGKKYAYNKENLYTKTNMQFGFKEPGVGSIEYEDDLIILKGGNFTENSKVCVNGKEVETTFYGDTVLAISKDSLNVGDTYTIRQVDRNDTVLMETFEYAY